MLRKLVHAHSPLPTVLRLWVVVPATITLVVIGGLVFTLPPGPLCDEGMVLFMEGGCDWGESNVFFFSKLGLLIAVNVSFAVAWRRNLRDVSGFIPHLAVLACLVLVGWSGGRCDTYYSHPNGSIGQMVLECMAFVLLGMSCLSAAQRRTWPRLFGTLLIWNAAYVAAFYSGLRFADHWTWNHSVFIVAALLLMAALVRLAGRSVLSRRRLSESA